MACGSAARTEEIMNANLLTTNRLPKSPYFVGHLPTNYSVHIEPATSVHYGLGGPRSEGFFVMAQPNQFTAKPLEERFWEKVDKAGPVHPRLGSRCWEWIGARIPTGYGTISRDGQTQVAHRVSWELEHGVKPSGVVCHSCDNPGCVRPSHLRDDTQSSNILEAIERGRVKPVSGGAQANIKVTKEVAREIRRRYAAGGTSYRQLASEYSLSKTHVGRIVKQECWTND